MGIRMIIWTIVLIMLYRFFSRFILPLFRITKATSDRLKQMQDQLNNNNVNNQQDARQAATTRRPDKNDYIDYEEIK